ncbi:uncharacterized protein LOC110891524 isoform X2 [Helianthus annuus]|uniref:uncharacterized protein LOC110891524 isoform X2 n=1 Tax=Helianthus annuus TaxID=4232 RepID=UPI000B8EFE86|nr:uncharacterized protein LOC110891524 isoform X2 [Helianthus annuus]
MKKKRAVSEASTRDNQTAELLLSLKPSSTPVRRGDSKSRSKPSADVTLAPNPNGPSVKAVGATTCICNISSKRKLDELNPATSNSKYSPHLLEDAELCRNVLDHLSTLGEVLAHRAMSDEISLLVKLTCLTPELLSRFERSSKVAQRKSKRVERYKRKLADKDEEIRRLKEEVNNLKKYKKMTKKDSEVKEVTRCLDEVSVEHQKEVSVLKMCLQDVQAQLEYKDRLLVEGVTELDSLVAELNCHSAKEQVRVEESRTFNESIRSLQSRLEELLADNRRLKDDQKSPEFLPGVSDLNASFRRMDELQAENQRLLEDNQMLSEDGRKSPEFRPGGELDPFQMLLHVLSLKPFDPIPTYTFKFD